MECFTFFLFLFDGLRPGLKLLILLKFDLHRLHLDMTFRQLATRHRIQRIQRIQTIYYEESVIGPKHYA